MFENIRFDIIALTLFVGSFLFWRILSIHMVEIYAHVNCHKTNMESRLARENKANTLSLLECLQNSFPDCYPGHATPATTGAAAQRCDLSRQDRWFCQWTKFVLMAGLAWMYFTEGVTSYKAWQKANLDSDGASEDPGSQNDLNIAGWQVPPAWLFTSILNIVITGSQWEKLMSGITSTISLIERNTEQMLLFTTLAKQQRIEMWDGGNRSIVRGLLKVSQTECANKDAVDKCADDELLNYLPEGIKTLDLTSADELWSWWSLRQCIQVDFVDESTIMDYCCSISMLLLVAVVGSAGLDWLVHKNFLAPGLLLACFLCTCLVYIINRIFQACIDINALLDRDARVLLDAEEDLHRTHPHSPSNETLGVALTLRMIARKIELFDDKQQIFGIPITNRVRNGWVASMAFFLISYLWEAFKPMVDGMDLDDLEALAMNASTNPRFYTDMLGRMHIRLVP
eukprot:CAMPEP_0198569174 /NCGR_PEP_ID=MMETSP1462-20131121/107445_1 /TAXON_ID=1333877 /ORGANISM="Brandtodinium nutriculum, Strain RCC3387" /LENGTH=455 /DNA_ID=CAMNT_0044300259 /DNA_START=203 /DNA_END=1567 /DNA_ORIENTATION=-